MGYGYWNMEKDFAYYSVLKGKKAFVHYKEAATFNMDPYKIEPAITGKDESPDARASLRTGM